MVVQRSICVPSQTGDSEPNILYIIEPEYLMINEITHELQIRGFTPQGDRRAMSGALRTAIAHERRNPGAHSFHRVGLANQEFDYCNQSIPRLTTLLQQINPDTVSHDRFMTSFMHIESRLNRIERVTAEHNLTDMIRSVNAKLESLHQQFISRIRGYAYPNRNRDAHELLQNPDVNVSRELNIVDHRLTVGAPPTVSAANNLIANNPNNNLLMVPNPIATQQLHNSPTVNRAPTQNMGAIPRVTTTNIEPLNLSFSELNANLHAAVNEPNAANVLTGGIATEFRASDIFRDAPESNALAVGSDPRRLYVSFETVPHDFNDMRNGTMMGDDHVRLSQQFQRTQDSIIPPIAPVERIHLNDVQGAMNPNRYVRRPGQSLLPNPIIGEQRDNHANIERRPLTVDENYRNVQVQPNRMAQPGVDTILLNVTNQLEQLSRAVSALTANMSNMNDWRQSFTAQNNSALISDNRHSHAQGVSAPPRPNNATYSLK